MFVGVLLLLFIILIITTFITCVVYWSLHYIKDIQNNKLYYETNQDQMKGDTVVNIDSTNKLDCKIVDDRLVTDVVNNTKTTGSSFEHDAINVSSSVTNERHHTTSETVTSGINDNKSTHNIST